MRFTMLLPLLFAPAAALAAPPDYTALPTSTLGFTARYQGEDFDGRFSRFTPQVRFDPAATEGNRIEVVVELSSASTANDERDAMLVASDFFDVESFPQARWVATQFRRLDDGRFVADGTLTLRDATHPVALTFTWTPGVQPVLEGSTTVSRLAFGVGSGDWADTALLPDAVTVRTRLHLTR